MENEEGEMERCDGGEGEKKVEALEWLSETA